MPELPTITVTDEQANIMLSHFGSVAKYQEWLWQQIVDFVLSKIEAEESEEFYQRQLERREEILNSLIKPV